MGLATQLTDCILSSPEIIHELISLNSYDLYTYTHSVNVAVLSVAIGVTHGMERDDAENLGVGALLHDIGKSGIPTEILNKPDKLSAPEYEIVKGHVVEGARILRTHEAIPRSASDVVLQHHERLSGLGYPYGLSGNAINLFGRICAIADCYDAMTTRRPYQGASTPYEALFQITKEAENYDRDVLDTFIRMLGKVGVPRKNHAGGGFPPPALKYSGKRPINIPDAERGKAGEERGETEERRAGTPAIQPKRSRVEETTASKKTGKDAQTISRRKIAMALVINTNIASISAQRNLGTNSDALATSVQRLSSGLRINSAKDDAAGLAVSEKIRAQVRSISVAVRNAQDGVSLAQTNEGGLQEIGNILGRMRELSKQSSNGTLGQSERNSLDSEYQQLKSEIDRISNATEFNGTKLLNGAQSATGVTLQVGFQNVAANDRITFFSGIGATNVASLSLMADISSAATAQSNLDMVSSAIGTVASSRGTLGAVMNRLQSTIANLQVTSENLSAADSAIRDADFAYETSQFTKNQILVQAATSMVAQANTLPQAALQLLK